MRKIILYLIVLITYLFVDVVIYLFSPLIGDKVFFYNSVLFAIMLWIFTIFLNENKFKLLKKSERLMAMFDYFDFNNVRDVLKHGKRNKEYYNIFNSRQMENQVVILTIKFLNSEVLDKMNSDERLKTIGIILECIEKNISKSYGIIYNIEHDYITCAFNTLYEIEDADFQAIIAALNINLDLMKLKDENQKINKLFFNMSIIEKKMDFFVKGRRVLLYGDDKISRNVVDIDGIDEILIEGKSYNKYEERLDTDYLGKFYFDKKDYKIYKVNRIIPEIEEEYKTTYDNSKIKIKRGKEKKLQKYILQKNKEKK